MKKIIFMCCIAALAVCGAVHGAAKKQKKDVKKGGRMTFTVTSPAFGNNTAIPKKYTCSGEDVSPEIKWEALPAAAKSLAIIMDDPDAPPGTWLHWIIFDIPAAAGGLKENIPKEEVLPDGSRHGLVWGVNEDDFSRIGYYGPCPPPGKTHHYRFKVYALDKLLGLPAGISNSALLDAMRGHILAQAELVGLYKR